MRSKIFSKAATLTLLLLSGCGENEIISAWGGKIYSYQVNDLAFERKQNNESIAANSIQANGMICMTPSDFNDFVNTYVITPQGGTKVPTPVLTSPHQSK